MAYNCKCFIKGPHPVSTSRARSLKSTLDLTSKLYYNALNPSESNINECHTYSKQWQPKSLPVSLFFFVDKYKEMFVRGVKYVNILFYTCAPLSVISSAYKSSSHGGFWEKYVLSNNSKQNLLCWKFATVCTAVTHLLRFPKNKTVTEDLAFRKILQMYLG